MPTDCALQGPTPVALKAAATQAASQHAMKPPPSKSVISCAVISPIAAPAQALPQAQSSATPALTPPAPASVKPTPLSAHQPVSAAAATAPSGADASGVPQPSGKGTTPASKAPSMPKPAATATIADGTGSCPAVLSKVPSAAAQLHESSPRQGPPTAPLAGQARAAKSSAEAKKLPSDMTSKAPAMVAPGSPGIVPPAGKVPEIVPKSSLAKQTHAERAASFPEGVKAGSIPAPGPAPIKHTKVAKAGMQPTAACQPLMASPSKVASSAVAQPAPAPETAHWPANDLPVFHLATCAEAPGTLRNDATASPAHAGPSKCPSETPMSSSCAKPCASGSSALTATNIPAAPVPAQTSFPQASTSGVADVSVTALHAAASQLPSQDIVSAKAVSVSDGKQPTGEVVAPAQTSDLGAMKQRGASANIPALANEGDVACQHTSVTPHPSSPSALPATQHLSMTPTRCSSPAPAAVEGPSASLLPEHQKTALGKRALPLETANQFKRVKRQLPGASSTSASSLDEEGPNRDSLQGLGLPASNMPAPDSSHMPRAGTCPAERALESLALGPSHQLLNMLPAQQGFQPVAMFSLSSWEQLTCLP